MSEIKHIDVNCDLGEGFGRYSIAPDAEIMPLVSSVNIACGFHAGDPVIMSSTVRLALRCGVAIGAHPGYADLQGFGRRKMELSEEELESMLLYQIGALSAIVTAQGGDLIHVKPHGALYNQAAIDEKLARLVAGTVKKFSTQLILVGLAGSLLVRAGEEMGLRTAREGFPERTYEADGTLRPRQYADALIDDPALAAKQALNLVTQGIVFRRNEEMIKSDVDTLCVHGDSSGAVKILRSIQQRFLENSITVQHL